MTSLGAVAVHDGAGRALVERSQGAAMLVLGSGRKGAVTRTVLGSVSEYCVRHAPVPVVVVAETSGEVPAVGHATRRW